MKPRFNKKGLEKVTLILLVAMLTVLIAYLFFYKGFGEASERSAEITACKSSVDRNARLHISGFEFPTSINCPARNIKITKSDDSAKKTIADAMADCWYQYGEGKLNLFKDEATYCAVCSFINVDTKDPIVGLPIFLMTEQVPDNSGKLYLDYLAGYRTPRAEQVLGGLKDSPDIEAKAQGELPGERTYAVVFVYAKGLDEMRKLAEHLTLKTFESKAGLAVGSLIGLSAGVGIVGTTATVTFLTLGAVTGPPGWVVIGAAVTIGATAGFVTSFFASPDKAEWAAFTALKEWDETKTADILKNEFGCTYFPAKLE